MNGARVDFNEAAVLSAMSGKVHRELLKTAHAVVAEARRLCPRGRTGKLRRGIKVIVKGEEILVFVPHPGRFIEFGHDIIQDGKKVGHAPARPFLRPAIMRVAGNFGESYGAAAGEYTGAAFGTAVGTAIGYRYGGALLAKAMGTWGRRKGGQLGREVWSKAGRKVADMVEARTMREKAGHAAGAALELGSHMTARRGG